MESRDVEAKVPYEKPAPVVDEDRVVAKPSGVFGHLRYYEDVLDRKLGVEAEDLRRVPEEDRKPRGYLAMGLWWASATMTLSCFSTGFLGQLFGLSLGQSIGIIIGATLLGSAVAVSIIGIQLCPHRGVLTRSSLLRDGARVSVQRLVSAKSRSLGIPWVTIQHRSSPSSTLSRT